MIHQVEALSFRSLRDLSLHLGPIHVLVGPNESGKTGFLDIMAFLGRLVSEGLDAALHERTDDFRDLVWGRKGNRFELALEASIPDDKKRSLSEPHFDLIRYELALGVDSETGRVGIEAEKALLKTQQSAQPEEREFFPFDSPPRKTILTPKVSGVRTILNKSPGKKDNYYSEVYREPGKGWVVAFQLGPQKSTLGNLPEDESKFPVATWFRTLLTERIRRFTLDPYRMQKASAPGQVSHLQMDGSNLPWIVSRLQQDSPDAYREWIQNLRKALPDIETVEPVERADDKHRYLVFRYRSGLEVPSWGASHGTLRLAATTLPAYLPDFSGVYLLEEPENGLHPRAVRTLFQSLTSIPSAQFLISTYSPVILSAAEPHQVICFAKTDGGATDVIAGNEHPALRKWRGEENLGVLFVDGVLGS